MAKITIPEPCPENWDGMTPTKRGAFCGKCQIDVYDFTAKSADEIKAVLIDNKGSNLCGKINNTQLLAINSDFYSWENQSIRTFQSKFLLACVVVFGMTLITGCGSVIEEENYEVGKVLYEYDTVNTELDTSNAISATSDEAECDGGFTLSPELGRFSFHE